MRAPLGTVGIETATKTIAGTTMVHSSLALGAVEWNERSRSFDAAPELRSADPFSFDLTTITQGPHAGRNAIVLVPVRRTCFPILELPIEIRRLIYGFVFIYPGGIRVDRPTMRHSGRSSRKYKVKRAKHDLESFLVCIQISQEAIAYFYSKNEFIFDNMDTPAGFLRKLGQNRQHIRSVRILVIHFPTSSLRLVDFLNGAQRLANLGQLAHVRLGSGSLRRWILETKDPGHLVSIFAPVIGSIYRRNKSWTEVLKAFGFVSLPPGAREICCIGSNGSHSDLCEGAHVSAIPNKHIRSLKRAIIECIVDP